MAAEQPDPEKQPQRLTVGLHQVVRFDGQDDHLRLFHSAAPTAALTVFLVAAPWENSGDFRGFLAANAPERRDYQSGFCLDLGPGPTARFQQLNFEGQGFGGAQNLRNASSGFGQLHLIQAQVDPDSGTAKVWIDGQLEGQRPVQDALMDLTEWTVGARFYTNGSGPQQVRGPISADVAELIVFSGSLDSDQSQQVSQYLTQKYEGLAAELLATRPTAVATRDGQVERPQVADPPPVQMLSGGFEVQTLPVKLTNVNNLRYRHDGKLVTLGYNGDIHLLTDTDGDGLEDHASLFWQNAGSIRGPLGMVLTPPDYPHGQGVFVASKGKVSFLRDNDGDDRADEEIIVASGWEEIPQNVDAVGLTLAPDGSLYFGLGTANFANGYLIDDQGQAQYDLTSERGTVQRIAPDLQSRQTIATGIRFPIAFAFNHLGDLFCTEQEGATWLANGNPWDELLHLPLEPFSGNPTGLRHYGFPPRHPRHNPQVIDEPSTFDFGPQHQSTCGMIFNEPVLGGPIFGPAIWRNNAIICGESRGKLWRTQLTKTPVGYVADSQLIAGLQMLTIDACLSPRGDLIVACHSGPPDWGTGPLGAGELFRVRMVDNAAPRPVAAWTEHAQEVRIAFDQPLDPQSLSGWSQKTSIQFGAAVRAGDRLETLVPPYAVVQRQLLQPRFGLEVHSASLTPDRRTLILQTDPIRTRDHHALLLDLTPHATEIDFTAGGVRGSWTPADAAHPQWQGYLPHLDLQVAQHWLTGSATHEPLWSDLDRPGTLTLETVVDLQDMLRPAVQAGETLDYQWPEEIVSLAVQGPTDFRLRAHVVSNTADTDRELAVSYEALRDSETAWPSHPKANRPPTDGDASHRAIVTVPASQGRWLKLRLEIPTGPTSPISVFPYFWTAEDPSQRPLQKHRFWQPWAPINQTLAAEQNAGHPELAAAAQAGLAGGSWGRGRRLFHSEKSQCYQCHRVGRDSGGELGPDLGNLIHRDLASVRRDIEFPSFAINPDYIGQVVELKDGRVLTGVIRSRGDWLLVGDSAGTVTEVLAADVERMQPIAQSIMPDKLWPSLSEQEQLDLLTYLLTPPPKMPLDGPLAAPPLRTRAEVAEALAGSQPLAEPARPLRIVLVDGVKDHGPGEHDYPAWQRAWTQLLKAAPALEIENARDFPDREQLDSADIVIFFQKGSFDGTRPAQLDQFLARGGGVVLIHWAVNGDDQVRDFARRIGLASWGGRIKYRHGPLTLDVRSPDHPIMRNFQTLQLYDESYWELTGDTNDVTLLATSTEDGVPTPQMWVRQHPQGRVFVSIPGHYNWTFDDPLFRILLLRGIAWTANEPIDRFNELVPLGARMKD